MKRDDSFDEQEGRERGGGGSLRPWSGVASSSRSNKPNRPITRGGGRKSVRVCCNEGIH